MRTVWTVLAVMALALLLGGASALWSVREQFGGGQRIAIGPWRGEAPVGLAEVDPYAVARSVKDGTVPMGAAEGLALVAETDSNGARLERACTYRLAGRVPPARLWTLTAYDAAGRRIAPPPGGVSALISSRLVQLGDDPVVIEAAASPRAGNWLGLTGDGPFRLVMRLYDTPVTADTQVVEPEMPRIERGVCRR